MILIADVKALAKGASFLTPVSTWFVHLAPQDFHQANLIEEDHSLLFAQPFLKNRKITKYYYINLQEDFSSYLFWSLYLLYLISSIFICTSLGKNGYLQFIVRIFIISSEGSGTPKFECFDPILNYLDLLSKLFSHRWCYSLLICWYPDLGTPSYIHIFTVVSE